MRIGDTVDDFVAVDQHGASTSLGDLVAEGPVVLFFFPKAMSPG